MTCKAHSRWTPVSRHVKTGRTSGTLTAAASNSCANLELRKPGTWSSLGAHHACLERGADWPESTAFGTAGARKFQEPEARQKRAQYYELQKCNRMVGQAGWTNVGCSLLTCACCCRTPVHTLGRKQQFWPSHRGVLATPHTQGHSMWHGQQAVVNEALRALGCELQGSGQRAPRPGLRVNKMVAAAKIREVRTQNDPLEDLR